MDSVLLQKALGDRDQGKQLLETLLCSRIGTEIRIPSPGASAMPNYT